jgi:hypothetical protein
VTQGRRPRRATPPHPRPHSGANTLRAAGLQHPMPTTLGMSGALLARFIPRSVRRYTRRSR